MAKLNIGGTWAGVIEVVLEEWTVSMLRIEVAKRSNCGPKSINLICAGKVLRDGNGTEKLAQLGVKNNARILASRGCVEEGKSLEEEFLAEEEHSRRLSRVKRLSLFAIRRTSRHLRLELLEGVVAYHNGDFDRSRKALTSAHAKYVQVPDEALSLVMSMGFKERDAKRALRMSNQDVGSAVDFLVEEKAKRAHKREEDNRRRTEIMWV